MGDFQINCSDPGRKQLHQKPKKNNFQKTVEYSDTRAATSTCGLEERAAETIIAPEVETAATPKENISTNKAYIIMLQDTKEE